MEKAEIIRLLDRRMSGYHDRGHDYRGREVTYNISGTSRRPDPEYAEDHRHHKDYEDKEYPHSRMLRLSKTDMNRWKQMMYNVDGSHGEHYDLQTTMHIAEKLGIRFDEFSEKEFCLALNMIYSDYGNVIRKYCPPDKELMVCAEMALAFLDDPDGPEPSEKLALYYHCIADSE